MTSSQKHNNEEEGRAFGEGVSSMLNVYLTLSRHANPAPRNVSLYVPQWELWCLDTFFLSLSLPASPWPAASCCQCYCGQCHLWWAARNSCQWQTHSYLKQPEPQLMNWKMVLITYTVPASNCFLRLGSGGSGIPYFSRLSAARSRYFIYIENKKKQGRSILTSAFFFFNSLIHVDVNLKHPLIWSVCSLKRPNTFIFFTTLGHIACDLKWRQNCLSSVNIWTGLLPETDKYYRGSLRSIQ